MGEFKGFKRLEFVLLGFRIVILIGGALYIHESQDFFQRRQLGL